MQKRRFYILFYSISLALVCLTMTFSAALLYAPMEAAAHSAPLSFASAPAVIPQEETTVYLIQTIDGEVCVRYGDGEILHTGLSAALLPQHDRDALEKGITVESQQALTSLLEDLGA